jgi:thymidylate synthase
MMEKEWPIYYRNELIVGNKKSNIAICTLWTPIEKLGDLPKESFSIIGNLRTTYGINPLIKNIIANPRIEYIILCGEDLMGSGEILINFFKNGIGEDYKIIGSNAYVDKNIPKEAIEELRKNIKIIDLRNEKDIKSLKEKILKILKEKAKEEKQLFPPFFIRDEEEKVEEYHSQEVGFRVEGSIFDAWLKALDLVMKFGEIKGSEYGMKQKEILCLVTVIDPKEEAIPQSIIRKEELEKYFSTFFSKVKPKSVSYTYGERLFAYGEKKINQIDLLIKKIKKDSTTRRAFAITWDVEKDSNSENPPCLVGIFLDVKFGKLQEVAIFRSHDIYGAWLLNAFALKKLQEKIAKELKVECGKLTIVSLSAHVYEKDWKSASDTIEKEYRKRPLGFIRDERGYFIIKIEREKSRIAVEYRLNDGRKVKEFFGENADMIIDEILKENLVSQLQHAAYLGKELKRAEICLKENKEYVQV